MAGIKGVAHIPAGSSASSTPGQARAAAPGSGALSRTARATPGLAAAAPQATIGSLTLVDPAAARVAQLAIGSSPGSLSSVLVVDTSSGRTLQTWQPFGNTDISGVLLASGDVDGDGFDDLVAVKANPAAGSSGTEVAILLGGKQYNPALSGSPYTPPQPSELRFQAFGGSPTGPLSLAVRDLEGDGFAEIVLSSAQAQAGRPAIPLEVWSRSSGSFSTVGGLQLPAGLDPSHGYALSLGDLDGDGQVELLLGDLNGADLFVAAVQAAPNGLRFSDSVVLQPYGKSWTGGVRPTAVSAQQTLVQKPAGLAASGLPTALSLPKGIAPGPTDPLLGGLGTPGALIVQSASGSQASQMPWVQGKATNGALIPILSGQTNGLPIFSSGGVSYPMPTKSQARDGLKGSPSPVLVMATAGSSTVQLLSGPPVGTSPGSSAWQSQKNTANSLNLAAGGIQAGWTNNWTYADSPSNPAAARERYSRVTTALVSYSAPFSMNLNPLNLAAPQNLTLDFQSHFDAYISKVVIPFNANKKAIKENEWAGPSTPNSQNPPYGKKADPSLPDFSPRFTLLNGSTTDQLVKQFQQRLMSAYFSSLNVSYQHHYAPLWYSPQSWDSATTPTAQKQYLPTPPGRQTQGMDCSHTSSWSYNLAFGLWINYDISAQATQKEATGDWLTGAKLRRDVVAEATDIYGKDGRRSDDEVIDYLNRNLLPGDILYLSGQDIQDHIKDHHSDKDREKLHRDIQDDKGVATATHVITWVNDNRDNSSFQFVSKADKPDARKAFVIDSTGSESHNDLGQFYPNGVQLREFDASIWYLSHITHVVRWLTPDNVQTMARHL